MATRFSFTLTSKMPLLMHADNIEGSEEVKAWQKDPANKSISIAGDDRSPPWTWQTYLYTDGEYLTMPSANIMVCLRQAGAKMILKGQKTYKEASQSMMLVRGEHCQFLVNGKPISYIELFNKRDSDFKEQADFARRHGFRVWLKRAKIGQSKHIRARPRFDSWQIKGECDVSDSKVLTRDVLKELFYQAGSVGLGDWRPGCKTPGTFGMFSSELEFM